MDWVPPPRLTPSTGVRLAAVLGLVAVAACLPGSRRGGPTPSVAQPSPPPVSPASPTAPPPSPTRVGISRFPALRFLDPRQGWAGGQGAILATADGGRTWSRQYTGGETITALDFVDAQHGWALGRTSLLRTADGKTWNALTPSPSPLHSIDFADPSRGLATTEDGRLLVTSDGGASWKSVAGQPSIDTVCNPDAAVGWAVGGIIVIRSADAGRSWSTILSGSFGASRQWTSTIHCRGRDNAWVLFEDGAASNQESYLVMVTPDTGKHWRTVLQDQIRCEGCPGPQASQIDAYPGPFEALSASSAVFVGWCPACAPAHVNLVSTTDGGATWRRRPVVETNGVFPYAVSAVDSNQIWLLVERAGNGEILATQDGGARWTSVYKSPALIGAP
ncbi:MAG: WD40/YVTN/BNR-like repeat-containing protein [Actinomycetota bacterium]